MSYRVTGVRGFTALARRLRQMDNPELKKRFYSGINRAAKPLIPAVRRSAATRLPKRGGLAKKIAGSSITTKRRMTGNAAGVRIVGMNGYDIGSINRGRVRHLVYGKTPWVNQSVKPLFWDEPMEQGAPAAKQALERVMRDVVKEIEG
jgi:hypothetical protein